ncbi:MAG: hypothetical protein J6O56_02405 [Bacilli bacterium]|nr:hypothetical protein [Bacilli bacterium]
MIDIHSHLIYGVDDGSKDIETSINILDSLSKNGVTDIILTPHYITDTNYVSSKTDNITKLYELKREVKKQGININLYLGNEIYIDPNILDFIKDNKMCSLNNSEYILVELPMSGNYPDYQDILQDLIRIGFKVILAHPERYGSFQKDFNKVLEMVDMGVLLQCNIDSILGNYGKDAKKTMKLILKNKLVSFVGTDIHSVKNDYSYLEKAKNKFKKYLSDEEIDDIFVNNAKKIIQDK